MCQDRVQLSCGIIMNSKLCVKIIPNIAGMLISGLLYGVYLMASQIPNIDTIEQLDLTVCASASVKFERFWG